jgi:hypothetical protein
MNWLLPRLFDEQGLVRLEEFADLDPAEMDSQALFEHPAQELPTSGGVPIREVQLRELRSAVVVAAKEAGFPGKLPGATAAVDKALTVEIRKHLPVTPHAASDRAAWTFITCCVLPDIAAWRFPKRAPERFLGDVNRNTFRRLWWRAEVLGDPPEAPDPVWDREDVLIQIMERPGLSGNPDVARAICDAFRSRMRGVDGSRAEPLMRNLLLRVMRRAAFTRLELLSPNDRRDILDELATGASVALGLTESTGPAAGDARDARSANPVVVDDSSPPDYLSEFAGRSVYEVPLDRLFDFVSDAISAVDSLDKDEIAGWLGDFVEDTEKRSARRLLGNFASSCNAVGLITDGSKGPYQRTVRQAPDECQRSLNELVQLASQLLTEGYEQSELKEKLAESAFNSGSGARNPYLKAANLAAKRAARAQATSRN